jgi:undecaprenyl-diphosphatase
VFARTAWPVIAFLGALGSNIVLRIAIGRMRPDVDYIAQLLPELQADFQRYSYPSGHASTGLIAYTAFAIIAWRKPAIRWIALISTVLIIAGTGFGRVYLGVHWPSDVLAGYLLGAAWLSLALTMVHLVPSAHS